MFKMLGFGYGMKLMGVGKEGREKIFSRKS